MSEDADYGLSRNTREAFIKALADIAGEARTTPRCSFCSEAADSVLQLIAGPGDVAICNECIALCMWAIAKRNRQWFEMAVDEAYVAAFEDTG